MDTHELQTSFHDFLQRERIDLTNSPAAIGVAAMLRFYTLERVEGCDAEAGGDMLLFNGALTIGDWGRD